MASVLLRTSARRGSTLRCFVSATPSGGELRTVSLGRCAVRRLCNSTTRSDQLPKDPNEKLDALLEELRAKKATLLPNDAVSYIFVRIAYAKQLSRSWMTGSVLVSGGFCGYYIYKHNNVGDGAQEGNS